MLVDFMKCFQLLLILSNDPLSAIPMWNGILLAELVQLLAAANA